MKTKPRANRAKLKKLAKAVQFLHKPDCPTCRKARNIMKKRGYLLTFRDIWKERLTAAELEKLIGHRDHTEFLNTKSKMYKQKRMKEEQPSRREAISLMAKEPSLIRRPIVVAGGRVVVAFDESGRLRL